MSYVMSGAVIGESGTREHFGTVMNVWYDGASRVYAEATLIYVGGWNGPSYGCNVRCVARD